MITYGGYALVRDLLTNDSTSSITWLDIGTNSTAAILSDTTITNAYGETATESEPGITSVMFNIDIAAGEGNGSGTVIYREIGLLTSDTGTLVTRQVYSAVTKDATVAFNARVTLEVNSIP